MCELPRPYYFEEEVAVISGLDCLYQENNIREILVKDINANLNEFKSIDIDSLSFNELRHWTKWIASIDPKIETVERAVKAALKFLKKENLQPFQILLDSQSDVIKFREFINRTC